ncbi:MAG: LacI family transcriptional regulator [Blautia sp.]|nr:LacI family transcriptional regulator [Blautia sp.]MDY5031804.1 LacI family DNA-binding transcriptional regulator [Blautia sp.]
MSGIKDVAKRAGVSISTVSNVLNKSKYVSPELKERVEEAVEALSYEVDPIARSMKNNRTGIIGVITEDMCGVFYPYVVKGINSVAVEKGYQLVICDTQTAYGGKGGMQRERDVFRKLISSRVDGIIFATMVPDEEEEEYFAQIKKDANRYKKIPMVSIERDLTSVGIDSVYFDSYNNAKSAVQHLIDCGCKKICHITGAMVLEIAQERVKGYRDCMAENGLVVEERMIVQGNYTHQSGYTAAKILLENVPDADGIFCANDQMAIGTMRYLKEVGKRIPQDIKLMGYDDVFLSGVVQPSLSTIHIQKRHAGIEAARILIDRIENAEDAPEEVQRIKMEAKLVVRKSTVEDAPEDWSLADW